MKTTVHILATIRNETLRHAVLLVFKTLRTGFPAAHVVVWGNGLTEKQCLMMHAVCAGVKADFRNVPRRTHGQWIETLVVNALEPFWICDTDMVFFKAVQGPKSKVQSLFSGRYEPEFLEEWTGTRHMARLHPGLMWFNPAALRAAMRCWPGKDEFFGTVKREFFEWQFIPVRTEGRRQRAEIWFYDTCAGLHQALGGTAFSAAQNECFEHLHCGTYADLISPHLSVDNLEETHRQIFADPSRAKGLQREQEKYYRKQSLKSRKDSYAV